MLALVAALVQPAWGLSAPLATHGERCCCTAPTVRPLDAGATDECCGEEEPGVPVVDGPDGGDCGCRALPDRERPAPAAPVPADATGRLVRRHELAAALAHRTPCALASVSQAWDAGGQSAPRALGASGLASGPPRPRTAQARAPAEHGIARLLAFLSVARI